MWSYGSVICNNLVWNLQIKLSAVLVNPRGAAMYKCICKNRHADSLHGCSLCIMQTFHRHVLEVYYYDLIVYCLTHIPAASPLSLNPDTSLISAHRAVLCRAKKPPLFNFLHWCADQYFFFPDSILVIPPMPSANPNHRLGLQSVCWRLLLRPGLRGHG